MAALASRLGIVEPPAQPVAAPPLVVHGKDEEVRAPGLRHGLLDRFVRAGDEELHAVTRARGRARSSPRSHGPRPRNRDAPGAGGLRARSSRRSEVSRPPQAGWWREGLEAVVAGTVDCGAGGGVAATEGKGVGRADTSGVGAMASGGGDASVVEGGDEGAAAFVARPAGSMPAAVDSGSPRLRRQRRRAVRGPQPRAPRGTRSAAGSGVQGQDSSPKPNASPKPKARTAHAPPGAPALPARSVESARAGGRHRSGARGGRWMSRASSAARSSLVGRGAGATVSRGVASSKAIGSLGADGNPGRSRACVRWRALESARDVHLRERSNEMNGVPPGAGSGCGKLKATVGSGSARRIHGRRRLMEWRGVHADEAGSRPLRKPAPVSCGHRDVDLGLLRTRPRERRTRDRVRAAQRERRKRRAGDLLVERHSAVWPRSSSWPPLHPPEARTSFARPRKSRAHATLAASNSSRRVRPAASFRFGGRRSARAGLPPRLASRPSLPHLGVGPSTTRGSRCRSTKPRSANGRLRPGAASRWTASGRRRPWAAPRPRTRSCRRRRRSRRRGCARP